MQVRATVMHLCSQCNMLADTSWEALGLVYYKPLPAPPTLSLLIGPLLVIFVAN